MRSQTLILACLVAASCATTTQPGGKETARDGTPPSAASNGATSTPAPAPEPEPAPAPAPAPEPDRTAEIYAARVAAQAWLNLTDQDKFEESWYATSLSLREAVKMEDWSLAETRERFGKPGARKLVGAQYMTSLPGSAMTGQWVVLQYECACEKEAAIETVTTTFENGLWKVAGYYIRPKSR